MKQQLITEAKRFQQLAGIITENINTESQLNEKNIFDYNTDYLWFYSNPSNPNKMIPELDKNNNVIGTFPKGEVIENNELKGVVEEMYGKKQSNGTWTFDSGDFHFGGFKEGEDFVIIPKDKLEPLYDAYGSYNEFNKYLNSNNWELETGTEKWLDLVDTVGKENMPEYIDFIENTLKLDVI